MAGWHQVTGLRGSDAVAGDGFGGSVAISRTTAIASASGHAKYAGPAWEGR